jgi:hypothetical protein
VDATDQVDLQESFTISLRNELVARIPLEGRPSKVKPLLGRRDVELENAAFEMRPILDSDVSFVLYTHPHRDNDGERSSDVLLDNTLSIFPRFYLRGWFDLNPNRDFRAERIDGSATYEAVARSLYLTVGDRYTRELTNHVYGTARWLVTEKWDVEGHYSYDFETGRSSDLRFALNRIFHRFVLSVEYSVDFGENRNQSVYFKFSPVELWRPRGGTVRRM